MSPSNPDNNFLLRWLNGELSEPERMEWEGSEAYPKWEAMSQSLRQAALPPMDKDAAYARLLDARAQRMRLRLRKLWVKRLTVAAAVLATLIVAAGLFPREQNWATAVAEQKAVSLPDGSQVLLNAATTLSYRSSWLRPARALKLEGEAYFSVKPGAPFTVNTAQGQVRVLGTRFNVLSREKRFEVYCLEGTVLTSTATQQDTLKPGQKVKKQGKQLERQPEITERESPPWANGESVYDRTPLPDVFQEMERQYGVTIQQSGLENRVYSGRFPHDDIDKALQLVCEAMGLKYKFVNKNTVQITE